MIEGAKAFSSFAVDDLDQAERFYRETLGLDVSRHEMGMLSLDLTGDRTVMIYPRENFEPASYTILNFTVDDLDRIVVNLTDKGVAFERYEGFDQDEKGIARDERGPAIAWFKDPAGNILSVLEEM
jgi:catechol 2,3-dioxygenase-like lactoylglutathione lyase family enzyme